MLVEKPARAGVATAVVISAALIAYSLWWFDHPAPCPPRTPHCDAEFVSDPLFRELTLSLDCALAIVCGLLAWGIATIASHFGSRHP
jgi:hypothetical protein